MSIKDYNKTIIISDTLNGDIITTIDRTMFSDTTLLSIFKDLLSEYVLDNEHGIMFKVGYKNQ